LLCLVDDAHCLDQESADVLAFVARRLDADSIAIVFAVREPAPAPGRLAGLPELRLAGLAEEDARALLAAAAGVRLGRSVADQVIAETGGNPLALIEIGRELAGGGLDGDPFLPGRYRLAAGLSGDPWPSDDCLISPRAMPIILTCHGSSEAAPATSSAHDGAGPPNRAADWRSFTGQPLAEFTAVD
jgi:hypothetical protein